MAHVWLMIGSVAAFVLYWLWQALKENGDD